MKKKLMGLAAILVLAASLTGCNSVAKNFGGTVNVDLPENQKLLEATWKESSIWYLTRPMREGEVPETYTFQEDTTFGIMEGKVIFKESK
jgi:hypothetical protein